MADARSPAAHPAQGAGFGTLLRGWRQTRRMSQERLALDAEISQRHLSFLESGRSGPSREMVLHLSHVLDVPLRERNLLLTAAGFAPAYAHRALDGPELDGVNRALDLMLESLEPCPAVVVDRSWDLQRMNGGAMALFGSLLDPFAALAAIARERGVDEERNVMRLTFHDAGLRPFIEDWDHLAPVLLARIQREVAADPAWAQGPALLEELLAWSGITLGPERWLPQADPVLTMTLRTPAGPLRLFSTITTFGTAQDVTVQELRVEVFFPADDASRARLQDIASG